MLITQPGMDPLGRVPLLLDDPFVVFQNLIDDRNERIQLGTDGRDCTTITRRNRMLQYLRNRLAVDPEQTGCRALAHPINVARSTYPTV